MHPWATITIMAVGAVLALFWSYSNNEQQQQQQHHRSSNQQRRRGAGSSRSDDEYGFHDRYSWETAERSDTLPHYRGRSEEDKCAICLEDMCARPQRILRCRHRLHNDCYRQLNAQQFFACPICRRPLNEE